MLIISLYIKESGNFDLAQSFVPKLFNIFLDFYVSFKKYFPLRKYIEFFERRKGP